MRSLLRLLAVIVFSAAAGGLLALEFEPDTYPVPEVVR